MATTDNDATVWSNPMVETNKYGDATGSHYVRCLDCGIEVLAGQQDNVADDDHRDGCGVREAEERPAEDCVVVR